MTVRDRVYSAFKESFDLDDDTEYVRRLSIKPTLPGRRSVI